ncbi:hypothetical protein ABGX67_000496 [Salmonella enterica]
MEIKQPTEDELWEFLLRKYLDEQSNQELDKVNKEARKHVEKYKDRLMKVTPDLFFHFLSEKRRFGYVYFLWFVAIISSRK